MCATASGSSAGRTTRASQVASIPAAANPALYSVTASSPPISPPTSRSREAARLLEAVLPEEAGELFVGFGVVVVTLLVGEIEEVAGCRRLESGIDGLDAGVRDGSWWESGMYIGVVGRIDLAVVRRDGRLPGALGVEHGGIDVQRPAG